MKSNFSKVIGEELARKLEDLYGEKPEVNDFASYARNALLKIWRNAFGIQRFFILDWWRIKLGL